MRRSCLYKILYISLLLLFLVVPSTSARPTKAMLNVTMRWDVVADGVLENADLDVTIPTASANQRIISMNFSDSYRTVADAESQIRFEFGNVRAKRISANFIIETDYIERNRDYANDEVRNEYYNQTESIVINDEIKDLAKSINDSSPPIELYKISKWVYDNVKYDISYTDVTTSDITQVNMPSDWVMKMRTGVCDEFSNLFIALARAKGYASRIIIGYVYVDRQWIPHAWVETFIPEYGWVEIDPTHNQFLNLNALRVRTGVSSDITRLRDSINASSKEARSVSLTTDTQIEIINYTETDPVEMSVLFSPQPALDTNQPVIVSMRNEADAPVFLNAMFVPPVSVECSECAKTVVINGSKTNHWELNLKLPTMMANVKYVFPNTIVTEYGTTEASFERIQIEQSPEEKYSSVEDLPVSFKIFVGLFIIAAVAIVAIAIVLGL